MARRKWRGENGEAKMARRKWRGENGKANLGWGENGWGENGEAKTAKAKMVRRFRLPAPNIVRNSYITWEILTKLLEIISKVEWSSHSNSQSRVDTEVWNHVFFMSETQNIWKWYFCLYKSWNAICSTMHLCYAWLFQNSDMFFFFNYLVQHLSLCEIFYSTYAMALETFVVVL